MRLTSSTALTYDLANGSPGHSANAHGGLFAVAAAVTPGWGYCCDVMEIALDRSRPEDFRYAVRLRVGNRIRRATVTLDPRYEGSHRNLLLVELRVGELPPAYQEAFDVFTQRITALKARGRISTVKQAVVKIADNEWRDEYYAIAVHRMGPVPVFVLPTRLKVPGVGLARVAVFPSLPDISSATKTKSTSGTPTRISPRGAVDVFASLVATDVSRVLLSYTEEIFQHLHEMVDKLSIIESANRIREIRRLLSQSICAKLDILVPAVEKWKIFCHLQARGELGAQTKLSDFETTVCQWFAGNSVLIGEVLHLSNVARFCYLEFLQAAGLKITDVTDDDRKRLDHKLARHGVLGDLDGFCARYGLTHEGFEQSELIVTSRDLLRLYEHSFNDLVLTKVTDPMLGALKHFLVFLQVVAQEKSSIRGQSSNDSREKPVIFLSRRTQSAFADLVASIIQDGITEIFPDGSRVTTFVGTGGEHLERSIKARIWLSDSFLTVLPEPENISTTGPNWIFREAEHAVLLRKPATTVARDMSSMNLCRAALGRPQDEPLAHEVESSARELLCTETIERIFDGFAIVASDGADLRKVLYKYLESLNQTNARTRRVALLTTFLRMFERKHLEVFAVLNAMLRKDGSLRTVTFSAAMFRSHRPKFVKESAFKSACGRCKKTAVRVGDQWLTLISSTGRFRGTPHYAFNIDRIARALTVTPDVPDDVIAKDVATALDAAMT